MGKLTAAVCECGQVLLPPKERCVSCSGFTEPVEIDNIGRILTYTILHVTPEGFDSPLILAMVELDGSGAGDHLRHPKLVAVGNMPEDKLKIGLEVKIKKIDDKYFFGL